MKIKNIVKYLKGVLKYFKISMTVLIFQSEIFHRSSLAEYNGGIRMKYRVQVT